MSKVNNPKLPKQNKEDNVDQIREILFGSQERELNRRFEEFEKETRNTQKEILNKIDQNQKSINKKLKKKNKSLAKELKKLSTQQQEDFYTITKSQANLRDELIKTIDSKMKALKKSKISKGDMAQMMLDIAIGLKGTKKVDKKLKKVKNKKKSK